MKDIQKKGANKTKPLGIRINKRHLEFVFEKEGFATPQQAVNFLFEKYYYIWGHHLLGPAPPQPLPADYVELKGIERIIPISKEKYDAPKLPNGFSGDEPLSFAKMEQQMTNGESSFQDLLNGMAGLVFPDDKEDYERKIRAAKGLTPKQIQLLLLNLRQ